jgi:hypothetical protein
MVMSMADLSGGARGPNVSGAAGTFGAGATWKGLSIIDSPRFRELDRRQSYYDCTQHDYKLFDFDGRMIQSGGGIAATQPLISAEKSSFYVPLRSRRPSSPYRLGRAMVNAFTNLVFGEDHFPKMQVLGDLASEDFVGALMSETKLASKMIRCRNLGGCCGTSALSWAYVDGAPRIRVHNAKSLFVHSWEDREELIPRHVTEAFLYGNDEWNKEKKRFEKAYYWYRRDWTKEVDILFRPLKFMPGIDPSPFWEPDLDKSVEHNDGVCHVSWIQNLPGDDVDGSPDYEGLYENLDTIDILLSVIMRGATLNLDPTLVLKMDPDLVARVGVRKGSDNALAVGEKGDASYLELVGSSIDAGIKFFNEERKTILEVARCVFPDPDKVTAVGLASVAMKMLFQPMLGQGDILREQYGTGMARVLEPMLVVARKASQSTIVIYDNDGAPVEATPEVKLPPRFEQEPELDEDENPTGKMNVKEIPRTPGDGERVEPLWPPWFPPTPTDQQAAVTTLTTAVGVGTAVMSQQTATELAAEVFGRDPKEEWTRVQGAQAQAEAKQAEMIGSADESGKVEHEVPLPGGGKVKQTAGGPKPKPPVIMGGKPGGVPGQPGTPAPPGGNKGGAANDTDDEE